MKRSTIYPIGLAILCFGVLGSRSAVFAEDSATYLKQAVPERWSTPQTIDNSEAQVGYDWWGQFGDQLLDSLVERGIANNYNLSMAEKRMNLSRIAMQSAQSGYYPSLGVSAGYNRTRSSGAIYGDKGSASTMSYYDLGGSLSWEIDLFGRIKANTAQKRAEYRASRAEYDGAMLSLSAQIVNQYIQIRAWQAEMEVALQHIQQQSKTVNMTEVRKEVGLASGLDVAQAMIVYNSTQASIPMLDNSINNGINALAVLIGMYPEELRPMMSTHRALPSYKHLVAVGAPMDLLRRRPDIAEAEQQLAAQAEAIGIAKKDYLPTLRLNGTLGTQAHKIDDMFSRRSIGYTVAPTLSWTVFDGMQRKYNVAAAKEQMSSAIDNYNLTVMTAVEETDNAMSTYQANVAHIAAIEGVISQAQTALELSIDLYKRGLNPFSDVVTAQLNLLEYQDQEVQAHAQALSALVSLYKALGGGWDHGVIESTK